jgi:hypothetical protein
MGGGWFPLGGNSESLEILVAWPAEVTLQQLTGRFTCLDVRWKVICQSMQIEGCLLPPIIGA